VKSHGNAAYQGKSKMSTLLDALAAWDRDGERPICVEIPPVDMVGDIIRDRQLLICFLYLQSFDPCLRLPSLLDEPIQIHEHLYAEKRIAAAAGKIQISEHEWNAWSGLISVLKKWRAELTESRQLRLVS
jgi:hypothetical protein